MAKNTPDKKAIARWRYQQIEEILDDNLHSDARGIILHRIAKRPVKWPSGSTKNISLATLYRWRDAYSKSGLEALHPKTRSDQKTQRNPLPDDVIDEALRILEEDPSVSFTFLIGVLHAKFPEKKGRIFTSTLQRHLAARQQYSRIKRAKKRTRRRTRFVAKAPHHIWQTDAKGPVKIRFKNGREIRFHVISILDDATRAVLAALVVNTPNLAACVRVFRKAAQRWGLPEHLYADRASIFDSCAFRQGLADLGGHRIPTKPRSPQARGKIEAYHRVLGLWFFDRLHAQSVVDLVHLQQLLDGIIAAFYQPHKHRGLKQSPEKALGDTISKHFVPHTRLFDAFRQEKILKAHPKTGEVEIHGKLYLVPDELRGQKLTFLVDPPDEVPPLVVHPASQKQILLKGAHIKSDDRDIDDDHSSIERWGHGALQAIYDSWRGQNRPLAEPGFGLAEIYQLLTDVAGRHVPASEHEAALVHRLYRQIGPLPRIPTQNAFLDIKNRLGENRPIKTYLDALKERVEKDPQPKKKKGQYK